MYNTQEQTKKMLSTMTDKPKKPKKKTEKQIFFKNKKLTENDMKKLKDHSKSHKGGIPAIVTGKHFYRS